MNLNFFTAEFPYLEKETIIENEIVVAADYFDKIKIFPHYFDSVSGKRELPGNTIVEQLGNYSSVRLNFKDYLLILRLLLTEFSFSSNKKYFLKNTKRWLKLLFLACKKAKWIENEKLLLEDSVAYSYWMNDWALALVFLKRRNIVDRFVFRCGGFDIWDERYQGNYLPFRNLIYQHAQKVYPNSKVAEDYIKTRTKFKDKISAKYLGTTDNGFVEDRNNDDTFTIVSCSSVIPLKRVELIFEIVSKLERKTEWIHFGAGSEFDKLKEAVESYSGPHKISLKGSVRNQEILNFYKSHFVDLFISASTTEGLPVSMQEAVSFGIPVVGTDVGGVHEVVNSTTGYLIDKDFDSTTVANLIDSIETGLDRKKIRQFWLDNFESVSVYGDFFKELKKR